MASLLFRLEGTATNYCPFYRTCSKIFRSTNSFFDINNLCACACACGHGRMMSTTTTTTTTTITMNNNNNSSAAAPQLMLPPAFDKMVYKFYNLAEDRVESLQIKQGEEEEEEEEEEEGAKLVGSSHGWLAWLNSHNNNLFLSNPLTGRRIKLPSSEKQKEEEQVKVKVEEDHKLILSCSPDEHEHDDDCRALYSLGDRLAFCSVNTTTHWTLTDPLEDEDNVYFDDGMHKIAAPPCYDDLVYSATHKLFFCITNSNVLQVWDHHHPGSPRIQLFESFDWLNDGDDKILQLLDNRSEVQPEVRRQNYLVFDDHSNQLFVLRRHIMERVGHDGAYVRPFYYGWGRGWDDSYPYKTLAFDVYKITDWETKLMCVDRVASLDGLVMFVGLNHSFAVSAAEFPALNPNSIYFTDAINEFTPSRRVNWADDDGELVIPNWVEKIYGGHDIGIFSCENRTLSPCYYPIDAQSVKRITPPPLWVTSCTY